MPNEIPAPPGVPILGNVFDVNPNETWNSLNKLAKQYGQFSIFLRNRSMQMKIAQTLYRPYLQDQRYRPPDCVCW